MRNTGSATGRTDRPSPQEVEDDAGRKETGVSSNSGFFLLVGLVTVVGVGVGGAFVGGMAVGKAQAASQVQGPSIPTAPRSSTTTTTEGQTTGAGATTGAPSDSGAGAAGRGAGLRGQLGNLDPTQIAALRQQLGAQGGPGAAGGAGAFGGALTGTVDSITATSLTVNTPSGPLQATIDASTRIIVMSSGTAADLAKGANVTVLSTRDANGNVMAQTITLTPVELQGALPGLGGAGRFGGGGGGRGGAGGPPPVTPTPGPATTRAP